MNQAINIAYPYLSVDKQIKLQALAQEHSERIFELVDKNRDYLGRWLVWVKDTKTSEDTKNFIVEHLGKRRLGQEYVFVVVCEGEIVGTAGLRGLNDGGQVMMGYWIDEDYSGRGITTKVASRLVEFGFSELGLPRVNLRIDPENKASARVAEKLGFRQSGEVYDEPTGRILDLWVKKRLES
jgi:ribosomal-protein-serine acetyltransferase